MDMKNNRGMMTSETDEWATPQWLFDELNLVFGFDLDVCATEDNSKCGFWYTKEDDALSREWREDGKTAWMNPPYGREIGKWVEKASKTKGLVVCLVPARTDTRWWHDFVIGGGADVYLVRGRLKFGDAKNSAPFPSAVLVYWKAGLYELSA